MSKLKVGLLGRVVIAIILGIVLGLVFPDWLSRVFLTFNGIFGNFLNFVVPLIILGLIAPGIGDLGKNAGKLLLITSLLAYGFTTFTGLFAYFSGVALLPTVLGSNEASTVGEAVKELQPYFTLEMLPVFGVMTALILAFMLGLGISFAGGTVLKRGLDEFKGIIMLVINRVIIPLLPLYIFGIFLSLTVAGQVASVLSVFIKIVVLVFILTVILLLLQFIVAGAIAKKNPFTSLKTMMTAYLTALGTQSSAATIPVTHQQALKIGIDKDIAGFVIPLGATIHLSGSMLKITLTAMAVMMMSGTMVGPDVFIGFILVLGITMVAAPGVPGGAIMAAVGVLTSVLGFNEEAIGLMIALYIGMDSFGTAANVTGDGAIAMIVDRIYQKKSQIESE
ncbi:MAG TPA: dicarboxylate/amino acid:cation symporter [Sphingobacteriaceae bacterium]|nr:dicarboxylate/amino acid:cation symporter [Sphingobacteriaceae bacterium]